MTLSDEKKYELLQELITGQRDPATGKPWPWFTGAFNLNLGGLRAAEDVTSGAPVSVWNSFNDRIYVAYQDSRGYPKVELFEATTDPGKKSLEAPMHPEGTFTMMPGRVPGMWQDGFHKGKYRALVQAPGVIVPGWRGMDRTIVHYDARGINCHHGAEARFVDWYSAGCQVVRWRTALLRLLQLFDAQLRYYPKAKRVSYALSDVGEHPAVEPLLKAA